MSAGIFGTGSYYLIGCVLRRDGTHPCGTRRMRKSCGYAKLDEPVWLGGLMARCGVDEQGRYRDGCLPEDTRRHGCAENSGNMRDVTV